VHTTRSRKLKLTVAALCASAVLAAGCGGGGYKDDVKSAAQDFKKSVQSTAAEIRAATTKQQYSAGVTKFQAAIKQFNDRISKLKPPSGAKAAQANLISVLNTFSTDLGTIKDAVNKGDIQKVRALQAKFSADTTAVESAGRELENKAG
jgi:hypothetical protein